MFEIQKAGNIIYRIEFADSMLAICAFGALVASVIIGVMQNRATHATVNRQIIFKWIDDFRGKISLIVTGTIMLPGMFNTAARFDKLDKMAVLDRVAQAKSNIQLLLDVKEASHKKLKDLLSQFATHSLNAIDNKESKEQMESLSADITTLSKVIIDQKMVLVRAGKLEASIKNRAEMDVYFNSWPEKVESDKEECTKAG